MNDIKTDTGQANDTGNTEGTGSSTTPDSAVQENTSAPAQAPIDPGKAKLIPKQEKQQGRPGDEGFRDDFTEVDELRLPFWARGTLYILTTVFIILVAWACTAKIDKIVRAPGKFVSTGHEIVIRPLVDSIVSSIDVHLGQVVHTGQKILTLDPTFAQSDLDQVKIKIEAAKAIIYRGTCELNHEAFTVPEDDQNGTYLLQYNIYKQRMSEFNSRIQSYNSQILSARESSRSASAQLKELQNQLQYAEQIMQMRQEVYQKGFDTKLNLLQAENDYSRYKNQAESLQNSIAESNLKIKQMESEKSAYIDNWNKELTTEVAKYKSELDTYLEQQSKAARLSQLVDITAHQESVVLEVGRISVGAVAKTGEALMTLVPLNEPIEAEVHISPRDVGFIRSGDECKIKIDAFPFQKHGALQGSLKSISEDTIMDKTPSSQNPGSYYLGRVSLSSTRLENVPEDTRLMPGMSLSTEIVVGHRTVISYLLYPMISMFNESIREP